MAAVTNVAYVANTNNLELTGLKSLFEDTFVNGALVTYTIKDSQGAPLEGVEWPQTMEYVPSSNGNYVGWLSHNLGLLNGKKYTAIIEADGSDSSMERYGHWELAFVAETRR